MLPCDTAKKGSNEPNHTQWGLSKSPDNKINVRMGRHDWNTFVTL